MTIQTPTVTNRARCVLPALLALIPLLCAGVVRAGGPPTPPASLYVCQVTSRVEGARLQTLHDIYVGTCLQVIAAQLMIKGVTPTAAATAAAPTCVGVFRRLNDSRMLGASTREILRNNVSRRCTPGGALVTHQLNDVTGKGAGLVPQQINTKNIDQWCANFGGDGSIDTVPEWISCLTNSAECAANEALSHQFPRLLEWLALVRPKMLLIPSPATDTMRTSDAVAALDAVVAAIDGPNKDGQPSIQCGENRVFATGQTTCYDSSGTPIACAGTGQDGELQKGTAHHYLDNGDGTITDTKTGLMWEKKSDDGTLHDKDGFYTWDNAFSVFVAGLNSANFAGHNDWRLPNINELQSLADYSTAFPALNAVFNTGCAPSCTVLTCSCDAAFYYWSSTSFAIPAGAWIFDSGSGLVSFDDKTGSNYVRAVRGGS